MLDTCVVESPFIRIDGFTFALPVMVTSIEEGTFEQIEPGVFNVCNGATVTFSDNFPALYGEHTWYKCFPSDIPPVSSDPCILEGFIGDTISVEESGSYGFFACTEYCPDQCSFLGTFAFSTVNFGDWDFCLTNTEDHNSDIQLLTLFPNPTQDFLILDGQNRDLEKFEVEIFDFSGKKILFIPEYFSGNSIDVTPLNSGNYTIFAKGKNKKFTSKFIKK